jgi:thioredoxin 1
MFKKLLLITVTIALMFGGSQAYCKPPAFVDTPEDAFALSEGLDLDVLLIFTASWCQSCVVMKNDLNNNLSVIDDMIVCYVDHDNRQDMVKEYQVRVLPTYFVYRKKKELKKAIGYKGLSKFKTWLNNDRQ